MLIIRYHRIYIDNVYKQRSSASAKMFLSKRYIHTIHIDIYIAPLHKYAQSAFYISK